MSTERRAEREWHMKCRRRDGDGAQIGNVNRANMIRLDLSWHMRQTTVT